MIIKKNIWESLKASRRPFFVLAPMDDVTDTLFRKIVKRVGSPDLMYTEFANTEGYCSPGKKAIFHRKLAYSPEERPLIAQIWGTTPANYKSMASELVEQGFDGV